MAPDNRVADAAAIDPSGIGRSCWCSCHQQCCARDGRVIYRRKRGLSVPIAGWINDGLRAEVDRLLDPKRLRAEGLVNETVVTELLAAHRAGRANHAKPLWALVMLEYWLETWGR